MLERDTPSYNMTIYKNASLSSTFFSNDLKSCKRQRSCVYPCYYALQQTSMFPPPFFFFFFYPPPTHIKRAK